MTFRGAFALTVRTVFTDASAVATLVLAVVLYSFFYPAAYQAQVVTSLPVAVVDLDHSGLSRSLIRRVAATQGAHLVAMPETFDEARSLLATDIIDAILVIPAGLSRNAARGQAGQIMLFGSGLNLNRAKTTLVALGEALGATGRDAALTRARYTGAPAPPSIRLIPRPLYNTREGYGSAVVPAVAPVIIHQTLLFGMVMLAGTRREGMGRLRFSLPGFAGVASAFATLGMLNALYYQGWMYWVQDFPVNGGIGAALVATSLFIAASVMFAMFVGSFFRTRERSVQLLAVTTVPMFFLSGFTWPSPPLPLHWLAQLLPTTPGIAALVGVNQMGASLAEVHGALGHLALLALAYGLLAWWRLCIFNTAAEKGTI
ncbi:ABC transporter permease [Sandarakinorhabdus sp.]|uniref:ABC transporter permease n=1 Tax=Sandarakinorhabdus sp. TaxID=1916663 RepID=UPI00286DD189|nr:ABC transporter permease [Sandarakinorhabdus sp.]